MIFPHGSVESSHPLMMKRRKHTKIDVQPVDGWRVVMSLKSGLLMESTWALDVLNILLFDDNAFTYFGLGNLPGLFEAVLEQWRASLVSMFGITEELGISSVKEDATNSRRRACEATREGKRKWFQRKYHKRLVNEGALFAQADLNEEEDTKSINSAEEEYDLGLAAKIDHLDSRMVLEAGGNYTKRPRFSEEDVQFDERNDELFIMDGQRNWDLTNEPYEGSSLHWEMGGGDNTNHLVEAFSGSLEIVPFVRILEELKPATSIKEETAGPSKEAFAGENRIPTTAGIVKTEPGEEGAAEEANQEEEHEPQEDIVDKITRLTGIVLRDPEIARKRLNEDCLENECYMRDEPSLIVTSDKQEFIGKRAVCVSTILRNLSFVPGNEFEFSKNATFLRIAGQLLLLYHWYPKRTTKQRNYDRGDDDETAESCSSLTGGTEWWWESLHVIRENVMVILANIAGSLELKQFDEDVVAPILNGLLEWSVSSASYAQDPFPNVGPNSPVSPQRLAIEALCKVCLQDSNVDLILSTPPYSRIVKLTRILAKKLYRYEDQVLREFSINLLYYFSAADSGVARAIALADQTVGLMLGFIEQAEQNALVVAQQHGVNALRDNPDSMGTSLDMLRRAASTLLSLSRHPDNIPLFVKHEERLLSLVMSQILDQGVAAILSNVLFNIGVEQQRSIDTMTKKKEEGIKALKANDVKRETDGVEHGKHENDDFAAKNSKELSEDAVNSVESVSYSNYVTKVTQKKTPVQPQSFTNSLGNGESSTNISSASPIGSTIETAVTPS